MSSAFKTIGLIILLLTLIGVCSGPCAPQWVQVTINEVSPPSGQIPEDSVTITVSATEERTESVCYMLSASLQRWNYEKSWWEWAKVYPTQESGEWTSTGKCSKSREIVFTFEDVPLNPGENKFQVELRIDGCDGYEDDQQVQEVTYTLTVRN
jgi:hypothetical protein